MSTESIAAPALRQRLARLAAAGVLLGCAAVLLGYWHELLNIYLETGRRSFFRWLFYKEHNTFWKATAVAALAATVGSLLVRWLARNRTAKPDRWLWLGLFVWLAAAMALWLYKASAISQEPTLAAGFAAASTWVIWPWLARLSGWSVRARWSVLAGLIGLVVLFAAGVRFDGIDGASQANFTWRFRPAQRGAARTALQPTDAPAAQGSATTSTPARADAPSDYPRFRGADGQGTVNGANLDRDWTQHPPVERWRRAVGLGWSAFAVAGDHAVTQEQRGEEECVVCYQRDSGQELWIHKDPVHYVEHATGDGPRATPTIAGQRVLTLGGTGVLNCLNRQTGERHWSVDLLADNDAPLLRYGMCGSPLVVGDLVIACAGGVHDASLVAYHVESGQRAWRAGQDEAAYASPALIRLGNTEQVVALNKATLESRNPATGELIWSTPWWKDIEAMNCSQVSPLGDRRLFLATGYGKGATLYELTPGVLPWQVGVVWKSRDLQCKFCTAVVRDGFAYGLDNGILACISLADGKRQWKKGRYGHGQILLVDDLLLVQAENGHLVLVEATPEKHNELADVAVLEGKTWNHPALADNQLFLRNDHEAVCLELPRIERHTASAP
ncbi:MAG: PQQ-binding-like beta-propeller repeat protein [Pirellulales bacterium]|nr:PQQ-binding-like beta-propeller repeat protein [Pirellulales bacterium]